jgi:hypothetical protein
MHRNIARAYDYLRLEHGRIGAACITILPKKNEDLRRQLLRAFVPRPTIALCNVRGNELFRPHDRIEGRRRAAIAFSLGYGSSLPLLFCTRWGEVSLRSEPRQRSRHADDSFGRLQKQRSRNVSPYPEARSAA